MKKSKYSLLYGVVLGIMLAIPVQQSSALTINTTWLGGTASTTTAGGGNLQDIFNTAAGVGESLIGDTHTLNLSFGWGPQSSSSTLAAHSFGTGSGTPYRETSGTITFDNDTFSWFMDSTPLDSGEWTTYSEYSADLGGGTLNTGKKYTGATGDAAGRYDLFSVAMHEIGHSLGLSSANSAFITENVDLDIDVTSGIFAGSVLGTQNGAHLSLVQSLMYPFSSVGTRTLISQADLLANCSVSQFTQCDYGVSVPEPASLLLLAIGLFVIGAIGRQHRV